MQTTTSRRRTASRGRWAHPRTARGLAAAALAGAMAALAACGGSGDRATLPTPPVDTSTLVGRWTGSVESGAYGYSTATVTLRADSTMTQEAQSARYASVTGVWTVAAGRFVVNGRDRNGSIVTYDAPLSPTRLTGTWRGATATGATGTFTVAKQP